MSTSLLVTASGPIGLSDAAAAILIDESGKYILQHRSMRPDIWYPGHWGLFGGAIDRGEDSVAALRRELKEELEFDLANCELFGRFDFDLTPIERGRYCRIYYVVAVTNADWQGFRLHEGDEVAAFAPEDLFGRLLLTPYDSFALWLHYARGRLTPPRI